MREQHRRDGAARPLPRPTFAPVRIVFLPDRPVPDMGNVAANNEIDRARLRAAPGTAAEAGRRSPPITSSCAGPTSTRSACCRPPTRRAPSSPTPTRTSARSSSTRCSPGRSSRSTGRRSGRDLLRNEEKALDRKGVAVFYRWIAAQTGRRPAAQRVRPRHPRRPRGSTYANPPANFWRAVRDPLQRAESVAQVFLGVRVGCAR